MGGTQDPAVARVEELLRTLEQTPAPQAPPEYKKVPVWARILGVIGDALSASGAVRAGGRPADIGQFQGYLQNRRANYQAQLQEYQKRSHETEAANRMLRNNVRIGFSEDTRRREREEAIAKIRPSRSQRLQKSEFVRDVNGEPHRFRQFTDPFDGSIVPVVDPESGEILNELDLGPSYLAPTILPGMVIGGDGRPQASFVRIPKAGGPTTTVQGPGGARLEPQPPAGLAESLGGEQGVVEGIPAVMDVYRKAEQAVGGSDNALRQIKNWALSKAAGTSVGPIVAPQELVNYYASVRSILFPYVKSISGAAFPEQELRRYEAQFPIPGVDTDPEHKWNTVISQMVRDIKSKYRASGRTAPAIQQPAGVKSIQDQANELLNQYEQEYGGANPTP
jgi:hypothetical protein